MKKLFTLFTMLSLCIASTWAQDLDRSGWTILASSACDDSGSGQVNALTDGNTETFWHSRYEGGANGYGVINGGCPQAIQIDLGSVQEFNGIRISNRTDALGNGRVAGYAVYVSNTAFTTSASGFSANEAKGDATPVLSGTFTNTAQEGAVNMAGSKTKLSGRYVLFVITSSVNVSQTAAYACIAEVNLFSIPDGSNAYIGTYNGTNNEVNETKWQTEANWITTNTWNNNGPGYTNSAMWNPIYLKDVTASGITFEGWNLRIKLVNSSLTARTNKIQAGDNATSQFDVDRTSALDLTLLEPASTEAGYDPGTHTFNIDGSLTIKTRADHFTGSSTNTVNLGTTGHFTFKADADVTIGTNAPFTLNATPVDPSAENTEESRTLATFTNVTVSSLTVNVNGTDGWTLVDSREALKTQTSNGKYYYVGNDVDNATTYVKLYTFHETRYYTVTSDATLSQIASYDTYRGFIVNSGVTLTVDVENFDLTRISGAGNVVLNANASLTGNKATAATGKLTVNAGKTLTIGGGDSETNSVFSFTSIDLKGTIKNNNSTTTLNSVTVPSDAEGKIYSYDMGNTADGFLLAGTTTVNGTLYVCNKLNFQMKVDKLTGSGTWTICGTEASDFDADGTSSTDAATVNVASATSFTGSTEVCNDKATVNVAGNLVASTWTKSAGTLNYTGASLTNTTLDGVVLAGSTLINTSGVVSIKNLAGNNLTGGGTYQYAFVGSGGTISFYGTCDLTKKANGTTGTTFSKLGYGKSASIAIMNGATLTTGGIFNTTTSDNNAPITIETGGKLIVPGTTSTQNNGIVRSTTFTNKGTLELNNGANISAISGTGTVTVPEGVTATVASIANTATLTGAGIVELGTFPTSSAPTLTGWTGTVEFPAVNADKGAIDAILNAWGNANSKIILNSVGTTGSKGQGQGTYFNGSKTITPAVEIAEGATVYLNNGNSGTKGIFTTLSGAGTLSLQWTGSYDQQINNLTDFTGTLDAGTNSRTITVKKLKLASASYPNTNTLLFKTSASNVTLEELYIGLQKTTACTWTFKTVGEESGIYVESVDQAQLARDVAIDEISTYYNFIGTGIGKYTVRLDNEDYTDINQITTAIQEWNNPYQIPVTFTINQPTPAFYRLKAGSQYLQDVRKSSEATQRTMTSEAEANAANTLFYLDGDNKFVGYQTGYGFEFSVCQTQNTKNLNSVLFTESSEKGKYTIQSQKGTCTSASYNTGYWGVANNELSRKNNATDGANWTMETVTSIPVTFNPSALGYATFNSPVALVVPEGVEAYVCKRDGNNIKLFKANQLTTNAGLWILPANTPVLLYNKSYETDATKYFTVTSTDEAYDNNDFYGTSASEAPDATKYLYYALRKKSSTMGFYQRADQTATLTGFRAWIRIKQAEGARNFVISFDGDSDPTGIAEALGLQDEKVEIYDLNGRKLTGYQKGINIVNGKKVFK